MLRDHRVGILDGYRACDERAKIASLGGKPWIAKDFSHENVVGTGDGIRANTRLGRRRREAESRYRRGHKVEGLRVFVFWTTKLLDHFDSLDE